VGLGDICHKLLVVVVVVVSKIIVLFAAFRELH
jgi:hypothetical protein